MTDLPNKTEEEIYEQIGAELSVHAGLPFDTEELVSRGRKWFEIHLPKLQERVCGSEVVKGLLQNADSIALVGAIVDLIAGICFGVTPALVATLITKIGVKKFC